MLRRHYAIPAQELNLDTFSAIPKVKPFKDSYRALLDAAELSDAQREEALTQAQVAFDLNASLFVDLGSRHPGPEPTGRPLTSPAPAPVYI